MTQSRSALVACILSVCCAASLSAPRAARPPSEKPASASASKAPPPAVTADQLRGLSWRSIGPANMGGRVAEITFVPGKRNEWFVGTAMGGLFKTANGGVSFSPVFDEQPVATIGSVAVAPSDPKIVYVGTGEGNGRNSSTWGNGMYKSVDGGDTWTNIGLPDSRDIPRVVIHPTDPNTVYAAVMGHLWDANRERGLYKTTDGGANWKAILQIDENHGCIDVAFDPSDPQTLYAAMYARRRTAWSFESGGFGWKGGIYKSSDGGKTWRRLTGGLPERTGRIGLSVSRKNPRHVWAVVESDERGAQGWEVLSRAGGIFRSTDGGDTWERVNALTPRPFYFSKIVVDPSDDQRVYVLGYGLAVSDDGGRNFRADGARRPHGDLHTLVVDPLDTEHLLLGTDGGIYESLDRSKTWRYLDNIPLGQFYEIGLGMDDPYTVCGGLQDNGTWCIPSRGTAFFGEGETPADDKVQHLSNEDAYFVWGGDGYFAQLDPRDPKRLYAESQEGEIGRVDLATRRVKFLRPPDKEGTQHIRFNWNSPFLLSPHDPDVLYLGGNRVFRLGERGDRWEPVSADLSTGNPERVMTMGSGAETHGTVVSLAESPLEKGTLWAGTDDGKVWLGTGGGASWTDLTAAVEKLVPKGTYVSRIEASHFAPARAIVSFDGHRTGDNATHILETRDSGRTWRSIAGDLPRDWPVRVVREDPVNENLLFAGTEFGAFVTLDRGAHWLPLRPKGFPAVQVHDLQIHPRDRDLVAGTHGRSLFVLDDITGLEQLTPEVLARPVALLAPRPARGYALFPRGGMWGNEDWSVKTPGPGATIQYWLRERNPDGAKVAVKDARGQLVKEISGPAEAGLNRVVWDLLADKDQRIDPPEAAFPGQFPFVPAGEYKVELAVGKEKQSTTLKVSTDSAVAPVK